MVAALAEQETFRTFLDVGAGCGVIAYLLGHSGRTGTAVEIQSELAEHARLNLSGLEICVWHADVRKHVWDGEHFDLVASNPPYASKENGRMSPNYQRASARMTLHGDVLDFFDATQSVVHKRSVWCFSMVSQDWPLLRTQLQKRGWFAQIIWSLKKPNHEDPFRLFLRMIRDEVREPVRIDYTTTTDVLQPIHPHIPLLDDLIHMLGLERRAIGNGFGYD